MSRVFAGPGRYWPGFLFLAALAGMAGGARAFTVPAVPYLPQSEALCGGAALAMVLRYWGVSDVRPEDFAGAVTAEGTGIPAGALTRLAADRGFQALAFSGTRAEAVSHLEKGRPLIALLATAPGRHHYVVMLAWGSGRVLVHDPSVGPFRIVPEGEWQARWSLAGGWALLVLPPEGFVAGLPAGPGPPARSEDTCAALVQPGVALALAGSLDAAREHLTAAASWCPGSSAPMREMAALEFRRKAWPAAAALAAEAVRRDATDTFAWKLLATSRFLAGEREAALAAWNRVGEPRLDLVQIEGFERTRSNTAYQYLAEESGTLLTPERFRRVQRRMDALPAAQLSRVSYRPASGGRAQLDVSVVERPAISSPRFVLLQSALRALSEQVLGADVSVLAPAGEVVRVVGHWEPDRSRAVLSASSPRFLAVPGIVTAEVMWDEQSYRRASLPPEGALVRERRQRASLSLGHWWAADTRGVFTVAVDDWSRGRYVSLATDLEQRLFGDRVAVGGNASGWWSGASAPFHAMSARASLHTRTKPARPRARLDVSHDFASARSPLALWPGAGTGAARDALLRAHPLVRDGVIEGAAFGRRLLAASAQAETPAVSLGPATLRVAAFIDTVKVLAPIPRATFVDIGAGLRLQPPGWKTALRVDVATPWGRLRPHVSAGWQADWR